MPETVALRFRDFGFDTIAEHNAVIDVHGHVWWGWWGQQEEHIPRIALGEFKASIDAHGSLEIFLVDSAQQRLFLANLTEIAVHPLTEDFVEPGDRELVPEYYRPRECKLWFRFDTPIEEQPQERIREFSYEEVPPDQFISDATSDAFDGKRVRSLREMLNRTHRTMWFLRAAQPADPDHEVRLIAPTAPYAFVGGVAESNAAYLTILSDLHLSEDHHAFALAPELGAPDLLAVLDDDLRNNLGSLPPAGVILAGDLTWEGSAEQFEHARSFVSRLRSAWELDLHSQVLAIPGNHDITHLEPGGGAPAPGQAAGPIAELGFREFVSQALKFPANDYLSMGRRLLLGNGVPVDVLALNSCRLELHDYAGYGYVGRDQALAGFAEMGWTPGRERGPRLRILVIHHHVLPVAPVEDLGAGRYSLTLDAGELLHTALEYGVDLIVHGHQHQPFLGTFSRAAPAASFGTERSIVVHGAGSVGVATEHLGLIGRNAYSVLRIESDHVRVTVRARSEYQGHAFSDLWTVRLARTEHGLRPTEAISA
ncbi:MAG: metallophosphoesterase [Solirubrobacteraceae bacterium]|nr:metallophosphoesterase [Solirubrobacteraceae bacterium]